MAALPSSKLAALQHLPKSFNPFGSLFDTLELVQAPPRPSFIPASIYEATLSPYFPLIFGVVYFILAKTLSYCTDGKDRIQGDKWRVVLVAHNLLLAVYSGWT